MTTIPAQDTDLDARPTQADASLLVQLYQLANTPSTDTGQALLWDARRSGGLTYEAFEALPQAERSAVVNVMKWHETVGTLVKQGLLNAALVHDWLWVSGTWDLCRQIALGMRAETGQQAMWENFEALAAQEAG